MLRNAAEEPLRVSRAWEAAGVLLDDDPPVKTNPSTMARTMSATASAAPIKTFGEAWRLAPGGGGTRASRRRRLLTFPLVMRTQGSRESIAASRRNANTSANPVRASVGIVT